MQKSEFMSNYETYGAYELVAIYNENGFTEYHIGEGAKFIDSDERDNVLDDVLIDMARNYDWREMRDILSEEPTGYDYYARDCYDSNFVGYYDDEIYGLRDNFISYMDDYNNWEEEDEEDEPETEEQEEVSISLSELLGMEIA